MDQKARSPTGVAHHGLASAVNMGVTWGAGSEKLTSIALSPTRAFVTECEKGCVHVLKLVTLGSGLAGLSPTQRIVKRISAKWVTPHSITLYNTLPV